MVEDRIGYRYAKSIYDIAAEKGQIASAKEDMMLIADTCKSSRDLVLMLRSPLIHSDDKRAVLTKVFAGKFQSEITPLLMDILVRKGREQYIESVAKSFILQYDVANKVLRGKLTTAVEPTAAQIAQIKSIMEAETGESFEMIVEVDAKLLGGFILQIGDRRFDGSVASSLRTLKQEFSKNIYIKQY